VGELRRHVPPVPATNAVVFFFRHVHLGVREVGQTAGVVGVGVGQDDVSYLTGGEAEGLDPPNSGVILVELEAGEVNERLPEPSGRVPYVFEADAGIDQGESLSLLQQQAVADDRRVRRHLERAAVEVVNRRHSSPRSFRDPWEGGPGRLHETSTAVGAGQSMVSAALGQFGGERPTTLGGKRDESESKSDRTRPRG
jgi:hypothetical protein